MAAVAAVAGDSAVRVSCIGNSITAGSYPTFLQWDLGGTCQVQNAGVGATTLLYSGDIPWIAAGMMATVDAFGPEFVYIALGTNDSKEINWGAHGGEFAGDYCRLIDTLRALCPGVRVRACLPTPAWANAAGIRGDVIAGEINPAIRQAAALRGIPVVDLHTPFADKSALFPDGVHPTDSGAWEISRLVAAALRSEYGVAPDLASSGTLSASGFVSGAFVPAHAVDNNPFTGWMADNAGDKWLTVAFAQEVTVDSWEVLHAWNQATARITRDFRLQASDNGTDWRDLDSVAGNTAPWTARAITPASARCYRLYVTYGSLFGPAWIDGFVLRDQAGTSSVAPPHAARSARLSPPARAVVSGVFDPCGRRLTGRPHARIEVTGDGSVVAVPDGATAPGKPPSLGR